MTKNEIILSAIHKLEECILSQENDCEKAKVLFNVVTILMGNVREYIRPPEVSGILKTSIRVVEQSRRLLDLI